MARIFNSSFSCKRALAAAVFIVSTIAVTGWADTIPSKECGTWLHRVASFGNVSELPRDGWFVWSNPDSGLRTSTIKSYAPKTIKGSDNMPLKCEFPYISTDGKWILTALTGSSGTAIADRELLIVKKDGSVIKKIGVSAWLYDWFYTSPNENPGKTQMEIVYVTAGQKRQISSVVIDVSGAEPVIVKRRTVLKGIGYDVNGEFAVSKDIALFGQRSSTGRNLIRLYTIPNGGRDSAGTADEYKYDSLEFSSNCSAKLSRNGSHWISNGGPKGFTPAGCFAGPDAIGLTAWECRYTLAHTMRKGDPKYSSMRAWVMDTTKGGTAHAWAPFAVNGNATLTKNDNWGGHIFTNIIEYKTNLHFYGNGVPNVGPVHGAWMVNWRMNKWYQLTPLTEKASKGVAAFFDGVTVSVSDKGVVPAVPSRAAAQRKQQSFVYWRDIMGRSITKTSTAPQARICLAGQGSIRMKQVQERR